jgi:diguanylate cyclase (GGDEF)-like protein
MSLHCGAGIWYLLTMGSFADPGAGMQFGALGTSSAAKHGLAPEFPTREQLLQIVTAQADVARLGLDLPSVMQLVCNETLALVAADGAVVELVEGDDMVYRAAAGMGVEQLGMSLPRGSSLSGLCVADNQALICDDSEVDPRVNREACRVVGVRSMVVIPLHHRGETVGVLKAMARAPQQFHESDAHLLAMVSDVMAVAVYLAQRFTRSELLRQALRDPLTGLGNRALFMEQLRALITLAVRRGQQSALFLLDMDGLKLINDTEGHQAGDAALINLGARLRAAVRPCDVVARLGGDEFAVLLADIDDAFVTQTIATITAALAQPFLHGNKALAICASLGMVRIPEAGTDPDDLLHQADAAMYVQKRQRQKSRRS